MLDFRLVIEPTATMRRIKHRLTSGSTCTRSILLPGLWLSRHVQCDSPGPLLDWVIHYVTFTCRNILHLGLTYWWKFHILHIAKIMQLPIFAPCQVL